MNILKNYYQINYGDIEFNELLSALSILSKEGFIIFDNAKIQGINNRYEVYDKFNSFEATSISFDDFHGMAIKYNDISKKILQQEYKKQLFDNRLLYFDNHENCLFEWMEAGKYSTVNISREFISDTKLRDFCKALYISNYCVYSFI